MTKIEKILENLGKRKIISSEDWRILFIPVMKKMNIKYYNIKINVVSPDIMKTKRGFPNNFLGGSILKVEEPSLKNDEIWINNKLSAGQIVRIMGHELGHVITNKGSIRKFGRIEAESNAYAIDRRFIKSFNELYLTPIKETFPKHGSNKTEKEIYKKAWKNSENIIPKIKNKYIM